MISTTPAMTNEERAKIIASLIDNFYDNQLIIGNIHAPMDQLSDIFKIVKDGYIISGWTIFHGFKIPSVIFPPNFPEAWTAIQEFVNGLNYEKIQVIYPLETTLNHNSKPWDQWLTYSWEEMHRDKAMKYTSEKVEVSEFAHLPKIRVATEKDISKLTEYYACIDNFQGFWDQLQLSSDIYVIAETNDGEIVGVGGTHFETPATIQLGNIHVIGSHRGLGLGRAIMTSLILGVIATERMPTLFVNENDKVAKKLYESLGFEYYNTYSFYDGIKN